MFDYFLFILLFNCLITTNLVNSDNKSENKSSLSRQYLLPINTIDDENQPDIDIIDIVPIKHDNELSSQLIRLNSSKNNLWDIDQDHIMPLDGFTIQSILKDNGHTIKGLELSNDSPSKINENQSPINIPHDLIRPLTPIPLHQKFGVYPPGHHQNAMLWQPFPQVLTPSPPTDRPIHSNDLPNPERYPPLSEIRPPQMFTAMFWQPFPEGLPLPRPTDRPIHSIYLPNHEGYPPISVTRTPHHQVYPPFAEDNHDGNHHEYPEIWEKPKPEPPIWHFPQPEGWAPHPERLITLLPRKTPTVTFPTVSPPSTQFPITNVPGTTVPVTNQPITTAPGTSVPLTNPPITNVPGTSVPLTYPPITNAPGTTVPMTNQPITEPSMTFPPLTNIPLRLPPFIDILEDSLKDKPVTILDIQYDDDNIDDSVFEDYKFEKML